MRFCTILARNYLAQARVMLDSLATHHPGATVDVVVMDVLEGDATWCEQPGLDVHVLGLAEIGADASVWKPMRMFYELYELAPALKPMVLRRARELDPGSVVAYLDPDMVLFTPLEGLEDHVRSGKGLALTPHIRQPMPRDDLMINERIILQSGMFNLGFAAVGPGSDTFLAWWEAHLRTDALVDRLEGLFTDQKWVDLAPSLFDPAIIDDPGWNVAYWNLFERPLERDDDGTWRAGGAPLQLFHASGYDPASPHLVARHQGPRPRVRLSDAPALAELLGWYDDALRRAGWDDAHLVPYGWGEIGGRPAATWLRRVLRQATLHARLDPPPPDPYDEPDALRAWLNEPITVSRTRRLPRVAEMHWNERHDLRTEFRDIHGADLDRFTQEYLERGGDSRLQTDIGHLFDPASTRFPPGADHPVTPGIAVGGYVGAALGLGRSARLLLAAADATGLPVASVTSRLVEHHDIEPLSHPAPSGESLTVLVVNADALGRFLAQHSEQLPAGGRRVGLWAWELLTYPARFHHAFSLVDEVWTPSVFVAEALRPHAGDVPVRAIPEPILPDAPTTLGRRDLGLPEDRYLFGFALDARSVAPRKNPAGLLRAYLSAFGPDDGAALVVKVLHGVAAVPVMEELRWLAGDRPDIVLIDEVWPGAQARAFVQLVDCYVSLHRAEGYGRDLAQATAQGTPVIATGWSGNLEYMDDDTAVLLPYELVPVGPDLDPYPPDALWAEADLTAAAEAMRHFADHPEAGVALGQKARATMTSRFTLERAADFLRHEAESAYEAATAPPEPDPPPPEPEPDPPARSRWGRRRP